MKLEEQRRLFRAVEAAERRGTDPARHKCFVSYSVGDVDEATAFIDSFGSEFIPRVIGVSEEDDFIDSENSDYVMGRIREKYLRDSTVTIVLIGRCTWARRFVDWEVYSSLRGEARNGLMAVTLPSVSNLDGRQLPARVEDNFDGEDGYARWWKYPTSKSGLKSNIQTAFDYRSSRAHLVKNSRSRKLRNSSC